MVIQEVKGDIFQQDWQSLVVTVNLVGVMGAGIAKVTKDMNPDMYLWYRDLCRKGKFRLGDIYYYTQEDERTFILLPTKVDWKDDSKLEYIEKSLEGLVKTYRYHRVDNIHIPKLGCRNGHLDWRDVRPIMYHYLNQIDIPVTIVV